MNNRVFLKYLFLAPSCGRVEIQQNVEGKVGNALKHMQSGIL